MDNENKTQASGLLSSKARERIVADDENKPQVLEMLSREARERIAEIYIQSVSAALRSCHLKVSDAEICGRELGLALAETDMDLVAMLNRRSWKHGITTGKIAGNLAFRLSRFKLLHFKETAFDSPLIHYVQDFAALHLVCAIILRTTLTQRCFQELAYQMSRRHANQETLGVIFDNIMQSPIE